MPTILQGNVQVNGTLSASDMDIPAGAVTGDSFSSQASERLPANKALHQFPVTQAQKTGVDATSETTIQHIALGDGELVSFEVVADVVPQGTGCDKQISIDVEKWSGAAWSSLLAAALVIDSAKTAKTVYTATLAADPSYDAGDLLRITFTASGSVGSQAQGIAAVAMVQEEPS